MGFLVDLLIGAVLGLAFVALTRAFGRLERALFAGCLLVAALAYVDLGLEARSGSELVLEFGGSVLFAALGMLGLVSSLWFLALGWAIHAAWDLAIPSLADVSYMPPWYAAACVGFDVVVAAYLTGRARGLLPMAGAPGHAQAA